MTRVRSASFRSLRALAGIGALVPLAIALVTTACSKSDVPTPAGSASAATSAASAPTTHAAQAGSATATTDGGAPREAASAGGTAAAQAGGFAGKYTTSAGTLYIPAEKDWSAVKQVKDDPAKGMGEGDLALTVDPSGRVTGTIDSGPVAPAVIDGSLVDGELRGTIRRKDPKDDGLTGTLVAKLAGDAAEGKLELADANAAILREAKVTLKKK